MCLSQQHMQPAGNWHRVEATPRDNSNEGRECHIRVNNSVAGNSDSNQGRVKQQILGQGSASLQGYFHHDRVKDLSGVMTLPELRDCLAVNCTSRRAGPFPACQGIPIRVHTSQHSTTGQCRQGSSSRDIKAGLGCRPEGSDHGNSLRLVISQLVYVHAICQLRRNHLQHHLLQVTVGSKALQPLDLYICHTRHVSTAQHSTAQHSTAQRSHSFQYTNIAELAASASVQSNDHMQAPH